MFKSNKEAKKLKDELVTNLSKNGQRFYQSKRE